MRKWQTGYAADLKLANGGSTPSFLISLRVFEHMKAPHMYDGEGGSRVVIQHL